VNQVVVLRSLHIVHKLDVVRLNASAKLDISVMIAEVVFCVVSAVIKRRAIELKCNSEQLKLFIVSFYCLNEGQ